MSNEINHQNCGDVHPDARRVGHLLPDVAGHPVGNHQPDVDEAARDDAQRL
ncbi:hypothetical protein [Salinigranum halophilum]|jgi:hypothetical protein|uniref:hypothetical protein n=1 Tax=Salinigranum halophilum TaxID=2565931 RepID=UPI00137637E3|nr:hypothetical protein [Salinigranum halophilum]